MVVGLFIRPIYHGQEVRKRTIVYRCKYLSFDGNVHSLSSCILRTVVYRKSRLAGDIKFTGKSRRVFLAKK